MNANTELTNSINVLTDKIKGLFFFFVLRLNIRRRRRAMGSLFWFLSKDTWETAQHVMTAVILNKLQIFLSGNKLDCWLRPPSSSQTPLITVPSLILTLGHSTFKHVWQSVGARGQEPGASVRSSCGDHQVALNGSLSSVGTAASTLNSVA
jgi:hypothetical protein